MAVDLFNIIKTIKRNLNKGEKYHLTKVLSVIKNYDKTFDINNYGCSKASKFFEELVKKDINFQLIEEEGNLGQVHHYFLIKSSPKKINYREPIPKNNKSETKVFNYEYLFKKDKMQSNNNVFCYFDIINNDGKEYLKPLLDLVKIASEENWNYSKNKSNKEFPILRNYLNYTFLRLQKEEKIVYNDTFTIASFNTGLQTNLNQDIYIVFQKDYRYEDNKTLIPWLFKSFEIGTTKIIRDLPSIPEIATYITDASDLVFDYAFDIEINTGHIIKENNRRFPKKYHGDENHILLTHIIEGAKSKLIDNLKRNYKIAIPQWYENKIQLLLPLYLDDTNSPDLAFVVEKDKKNNKYYIETILDINNAYSNARLICKQDKQWLTRD